MTRYGGIRLGDSHTGGGTMLEASGFPVDGINLCVIGDRGYCPTHNGSFPLVSTGNPFGFTLNGRPAVYEPAKLACGCSVISSCRDFFAWVDEGGASALARAQGLTQGGQLLSRNGNPPTADKAFNDRFRLVDNEMGEPLARCEYVVRRANGQSEYGVTDGQGYTHLVGNTNDAEGIRIELGNWVDSNEQ